jgi:signal transduction histidine kinase
MALREALSNVARHARATATAVRLVVDGDDVLTTVTDDGVGVGASTGPGQGLRNLRDRAARLGGNATVTAYDVDGDGHRGTRVEWRVPIARNREADPAPQTYTT